MPSDPFQDLTQQLPGNFLILGDFNAYGTVWGCSHKNSRGRHLEDIIHRNNICILNTVSQTHIALPSGSTSEIDLSLSSASLADRFRWQTHASPCGSDHFPIWLWADMPHPGARTPQWNLRKADWTSFTADCNIELDLADAAVVQLYMPCHAIIVTDDDGMTRDLMRGGGPKAPLLVFHQ